MPPEVTTTVEATLGEPVTIAPEAAPLFTPLDPPTTPEAKYPELYAVPPELISTVELTLGVPVTIAPEATPLFAPLAPPTTPEAK